MHIRWDGIIYSVACGTQAAFSVYAKFSVCFKKSSP